MDESTLKRLKSFSIDIRKGILRQLEKRGFGHLGGSMSAADIISVLYGLDMNINPKNPLMEGHDMLVVSKGHAGPAVYAALALKGFFPEEWLDTLNQPGTNLPSHCDRKLTPGVDMTTGSLGQGLSVACGIAFAAKKDHPAQRVFCITGDGEAQEGQIWEAAMFASQYKLSNLILFLDYNKVQLDGALDAINSLSGIEDRFSSFGWNVQSIDGHDHRAIHDAIIAAETEEEKPSVIIANTIKGKDCIFANPLKCHHINISAEQAAEAYQALEELRKEL